MLIWPLCWTKSSLFACFRVNEYTHSQSSNPSSSVRDWNRTLWSTWTSTFRFGANGLNLTRAMRATGFPSILFSFLTACDRQTSIFNLTASFFFFYHRQKERSHDCRLWSEQWAPTRDANQWLIAAVAAPHPALTAIQAKRILCDFSPPVCICERRSYPARLHRPRFSLEPCAVAGSSDRRSRCESGSAETLRMSGDTSNPSKLWMTHGICLSTREPG